ncbi:hypothetical protein CABS01_05734 [Colletotrichum abscissum]|uniref:Uncharacterized protein n=3 Tax=Colletotrichum acutatum species complex TaxID=2707335 RepID=A0A9P9XJB5_9PEZI|nr:uncharacterized protein CCOS01_03972 [Colletotrichum costaricense]XP_060375722.1 uncharacterized protein CTAM01_13709 [Colletotrichum tamarilloi]XP_060405364.1 uncharacterized protein CABS01_05734 [Colletotrichum abscissum]KAI3534195.1 hypothetical protein CSPX01_12256 [Colletotrichum filicis]KAI3555262.1 hypothetical protein CABS02_04710 [Colletotrichum abscissum]KAK1482146.1 hypothetical protein CTAM01_13709 [Colletotrichum tamarilloi]KAK1521229.1 hypothetical protein CABS01_05734 [Colle
MWAGLSPGTRRRHRPRDESIQFRPALPAFRASYGDRASYSGLLIHDGPRFARSQDSRSIGPRSLTRKCGKLYSRTRQCFRFGIPNLGTGDYACPKSIPGPQNPYGYGT